MKTFTAALAGASLFAVAAHAQAPEPAADGPSVSAMIGGDYSTGSYGAPEDTKIFLAPFSVRAKSGPFRASVTVPYLHIDGPANVVGSVNGGAVVIDPNRPTTRETRSGLGDLSLTGTYTLPDAATGGLDVDLTGRVKLPTASDSKGLGTGKTDFGVSADISKTMGAWSPFVTVGYRWLGEPAGVDLKNTVSASVGTSVIVGGTGVFIVSYDYTSKTSDLVDDAQDIFGAFSHPLNDNINWTLYGLAGLSEGSPDAEVGLVLTYKFN